MALVSEHLITMPGASTLLVRSLATIEGVVAELCSVRNTLDLLSFRCFDIRGFIDS